MTKQANTLFISSSLGGDIVGSQDSIIHDSHYQRLITLPLALSAYTTDGFNRLGTQLANTARHAHITRQTDVVEQISRLMIALPIPEKLKVLARCYQGLSLERRGEADGARQILERVVEVAPPEFKARALQGIGATYRDRGDLDAAISYWSAAGKAARGCDPFALIQSRKMIAIGRGIQGDHKRSVLDLENIFPLVQGVAKYYPALYYDILNALAVELGEVGRLNEAHDALNIALASRYAPAYPEWSETRAELEAKRTEATPSVVAVSQPLEPIASKRTRLRRKALRGAAPALQGLFATPSSTAASIAPRPYAVKHSDSKPATLKTSAWVTGGPGPRAPPSCHLIGN